MTKLKQTLKEMAIVAFATIPGYNAHATEQHQAENSPTSIEQTVDQPPSEYDSKTFNINDPIVKARNDLYTKNASAYKGSNPLKSSIKYLGSDDSDIWVGTQHWYEITNQYGAIKYPSGKDPIEKSSFDGTRSNAAPLLSPEMEAHINTFCTGSNNDFFIKHYAAQYYINSALSVHLEQNKKSLSAENYGKLSEQIKENQTQTIANLKEYGINVSPKTGTLQKVTRHNTSIPQQNTYKK